MSIHKKSLKLHLGIILVLFVLTIISGQFNALLYLGLSVLLMIYFNRRIEMKDIKVQELQISRKYWMITLLRWIIPKFRDDPKIYIYLLQISGLEKIDDIVKSELGYPHNQEQIINTAPDIQQAETELVKLEERASILLGITLFIPVFFAMIHLFRSVIFSVFMIELHIAFLLGQIIIFSQMKFYVIDDWEYNYNNTRQQIVDIEKQGRKVLNEFPSIFEFGHIQELGMDPKVISDNPSSDFFGVILSIIIKLPINYREEVLTKVLNELSDLPKRENLLNTKWDAYKTRVNMISIAGVSISALIAGISQFSIPQLSSDLYQFSTTKFLSWGMYILVVGLNWLVIQNWYPKNKQISYIIIYSACYLLVFALNWFLFVS